MRIKLIPKLLPVALLLTAVSPAFAQVTPAASQSGLPLVVGAGFSDFSLDWGPGHRMEGISAWVDYYPGFPPAKLHGLGVEVAGHAIDFGRPIPKMRQDSAEIGVIYAWDRLGKFRPYGKFLGGIASIDFPPFPGMPNYTHNTYAITSLGGGAEFHTWNHLWIRADYEYQMWHGYGTSGLNPNGFTIGASYDFRNFRSGLR